MTAVLSWHVQNFAAIWSLVIELETSIFYMGLENWVWKIANEMGPMLW